MSVQLVRASEGLARGEHFDISDPPSLQEDILLRGHGAFLILKHPPGRQPPVSTLAN